MNPFWLKALPYLAGIGLAFGAYFYVHHNGYVEGKNDTQQKWDKEKAQQAQTHLQAIVAQQNLDKKREATQHENLNEIDRLRANNHALWLRLPKAPCPTGLPTSNPPDDAASGVVHTPVSGGGEDPIGRAEQLVNDFKLTFSDEALRADQLVERCR